MSPLQGKQQPTDACNVPWMDCHPSSNSAHGVYFSDPQSQGIADPRLSKMHADEKRASRDRPRLCFEEKRSYEKRRRIPQQKTELWRPLVTWQVYAGTLYSCMKKVFSTNAIHNNLGRAL
jgi:hypothetical protein